MILLINIFIYFLLLRHFLFRTDPQKQQYTGALVGLGYDEKSNQPLLPDHDIELTFDVDITVDDLVKVMQFAGLGHITEITHASAKFY